MDWQDIITRGNLFYASRAVDTQLRTWSLKIHYCDVSWYEEVPLDDIDFIICSVLSKNGGSMSEVKLASLLGFSVENDYDTIPPKYADEAELYLFRAVIKTVKDWGLIQVSQEDNESIITLSFIGENALQSETKYNFYKGKMSLYENFGVNAPNDEDGDLFPFTEALGLSNSITNINKIPFASVTPDNFDIDQSQLAHQLLSQSATKYNLNSAILTNVYKISSCQVDVRVYVCDNVFYPIVFNNGNISIAATDLINNTENSTVKANKIEWAKYLHLLHDPNAILNYTNLAPFFDILSLDHIITDSRLDWLDKELFQYVKENANGNDWLKISSSWPVNVIEGYLAESKLWNWSVISNRVTPAFLIANINNYNWDFRAISHREDLDKGTLVALLDSTESTGAEWDWDNLMPLLDNQYIVKNIGRLNFDLSEFTKNETETAVTLIPKYTDKNWDWIYISKNYDLGFILQHISTFETKDDEGQVGNRLCLSIVIDRAFSSENYADLYSVSHDFINVIKNNRVSLNSFSANSCNYLWSNSVICLFESLEFISWSSGRYTAGFECNPYLDWNLTFFKDFHDKITTQQGYKHISSCINNPVIVDTYKEFSWDWETLSDNNSLNTQENFVRSYLEKLNLTKVLPHHNADFIEDLFENHNLYSIIRSNDEWRLVSEKVSIDFIRKHIDYNWDWHILTNRFYGSIKIARLSDNRWRDKWDWKFLTRQFPNDLVISFLAEYKDKWDWSYISENFEKEFIIENLPFFVEYWDWSILLTNRFTKDDLGFLTYLPLIGTCLSSLPEDVKRQSWTIITQKFSYQELFDLIAQTHALNMTDIFCWNYLDFYNRDEFYLRKYISEYNSYVDWGAISRCNKIQDEFTWDRTLFSEKVWLSETISLLKNHDYHWDFKALSQIRSLYSHYGILTVKAPAWDWEYITEFSPLFKKGEHFKRNFKKFSRHLKYNVLSRRTDTGITENLIATTIDKPWDWKSLSSNDSVKFTLSFINEHQEVDWDWEALSIRNDIEFDNQTLYKLSDKNWSWIDLSHRTDLVYDEEFITKLIDKPLDWFLLSKSDKFTPNSLTLSKLKGRHLSWDSISSNPKLSKDVLWDYKDFLNWKLVTNNLCDFSDLYFLEKYEDYLDWAIISKSSTFVINDDNLLRFQQHVIWSDINRREDFKLTIRSLELFTDHIDWSRASSSVDLDFTEELIEKYREKWNWKELRLNSKIINQLNDNLRKYKSELNCADFVDRFDSKPYIYHFTHLFNAVDIIRNRKILSRNLAKGKFANAAGLNVNIRDTAHSFARFYYRPQTPTQFYNECLGMDSESGYWKEWYYYGYHRKWKSYYGQALSNGLPKCPMPVFFKFDLAEVISRNPDCSYYSTGNMQTSWAEIIKITDDPTRLNTSHVYSTIQDGVDIYKTYSQQEFLVLNQLDFTDVNFLEIICYDEAQANLLRNLLQDDPICERITSYNYGIYHRNNRQLTIFEDETTVKIESEYRDNAFLVLRGEGVCNVNIINPENIRKETSCSVSSYPSIEFHKTNEPIEVHFIDEIGRDWLVYKNTP